MQFWLTMKDCMTKDKNIKHQNIYIKQFTDPVYHHLINNLQKVMYNFVLF